MEAELDDKRREQRVAEERLKQREAALDEREIELLQRELNMMIQQQGVNATPTPHRRRGKFTKSRLKLLTKKDSAQSSAIISLPSGKKNDFGIRCFSFTDH